MQSLKDLISKAGTLHHAYSIEGNKEEVRRALVAFLENDLNFKTSGNPDFWYEEHDTFTIDSGRELSDRQKNKSFADGRKVFVVSARSFTIEAQNSLLKVFEEPTPDTHFFIIVPSGSILLPTVRSRLIHIVHESASNADTGNGEARQFLKDSLKKRLAFADEIADEKDKEWAAQFLKDLEIELAGRKSVQEMTREERAVLEQISTVRSYIYDRAPSLKLILEHIALMV